MKPTATRTGGTVKSTSRRECRSQLGLNVTLLMARDYPNDSDGDALRRVASHGNDMSAPMVIEFPVVVPAEMPAREFASVASAKGYQVHLWKHEDVSDWDVVCAIEMVPTHADVVRIQYELTKLAMPFGGCCNCWGTFGNKPDDQAAAG